MGKPRTMTIGIDNAVLESDYLVLTEYGEGGPDKRVRIKLTPGAMEYLAEHCCRYLRERRIAAVRGLEAIAREAAR